MKTLIIGEVINKNLSSGTLEILGKAKSMELDVQLITVGSEDSPAIGLNEVKRIRDEMDDVIESVSWKGTFKGFLNNLRTNPIFYFDNPVASFIFLGLIGTVIGFIIALSAVDPNIAAEAENVASVIATLIGGMSIALNTTLVGATLYLWLTVNYRVLTSGTVSLIAEVVFIGERRAST